MTSANRPRRRSPARLIACPSVTPAARRGVRRARGGAARRSASRSTASSLGEAPDGPVENLVAIARRGRPAFRLRRPSRRRPAGRRLGRRPVRAADRGRPAQRARRQRHEERDRRLRRRRCRGSRTTSGTLSLLITGDEEGPATYGTPAIIDWLNERDIRPDMILIGEPTSERPARRHGQDRPARLGQHVDRGARARRATSPTRTAPTIRSPQLARIVAALDALHLDDGNDAFPPSNLEFTDVSTPTGATNVIPGSRHARSSTSASTISSAAPTWSSVVEEIVAARRARARRSRR